MTTKGVKSYKVRIELTITHEDNPESAVEKQFSVPFIVEEVSEAIKLCEKRFPEHLILIVAKGKPRPIFRINEDFEDEIDKQIDFINGLPQINYTTYQEFRGKHN